jgi:ATP-binding cassette subfamily C (CFTR/MRP) protein 1
MGESSQANAELERYGDEKKLEGSLSGEMITTPSTRTAVSRESEPSKPEEGLTSRTLFGRGKRDGKPKYDESLFKAIHRTFFTQIWTAGVLKLVSGDIYSVFLCFRVLKEPQDTLKTTTPLLNKVILTWLTDSYIYVRTTEAQRAVLGIPKPRGIGYGIGLAVALFMMQGISTFEFFIFPRLYATTQNPRAW